MKIYFPTMENLFSCDGNFSFIQWYQNNVIIGKTKSTIFQNEKYKRRMSFKYHINGA